MHAQDQVSSILQTLPSTFAYHHQEHTMAVATATRKIALAEKYSSSHTRLLIIAALFHDVGYVSKYENNEIDAAKKAFEYMCQCPFPYTYEQAKIVEEAIIATNLTTPLHAKHEKILRDADLSILGQQDFWHWSKALQIEAQQYPISLLHVHAKNDQTWLLFEYQFLKSHHWKTKSAYAIFEKGKQKNIQTLKHLIKHLTLKQKQNGIQKMRENCKKETKNKTYHNIQEQEVIPKFQKFIPEEHHSTTSNLLMANTPQM